MHIGIYDNKKMNVNQVEDLVLMVYLNSYFTDLIFETYDYFRKSIVIIILTLTECY